MASIGRKVRRHAPPEERRAQVLGAALRCFAAKGYHSTTMDDLVRDSGLSKGSLYWHFHSKQDVMLGLFDAFAIEFFADWESLDATELPTLEVLGQFAESGFERYCAEPHLLRAWIEFFTHPLARGRLEDLYARARTKIANALRRDVERGLIRDLPTETLAAMCTAVIEGMLLQAMVDPAFDARAHWSVSWEVLRRGTSP